MERTYKDLTVTWKPRKRYAADLFFDVIQEKSDWVKGQELAVEINKRAGYKLVGVVQIRDLVNFFRSNAFLPIVSHPKNGYKVSADKDEIIKQIASLNKRAGAVLSSANGLSGYLEKLP